MLQRAKQLFSAIHAKVSKEDLRFVDLYLVRKEKSLFSKLDLPTQKHSINVARTALQLAKVIVPADHEDQHEVDLKLLAKASLLHDIGKPAGGLKTWHRVSIVLLELLLPKASFEKVCQIHPSKKSKTTGLRFALYLQKNHPLLGGILARENNLESRVVHIIENHHSKLSETSYLELRLLQKADNLN